MTINIASAPKKIIISYMIIVFLIYTFSALNWTKEHYLLLSFFYATVLFFVARGFEYGYSLKISKKPVIYLNKKMINVMLILNIVNLYPTLMIIFAEEHLTLNVILAKIALASQGLGNAYYERGMNILEVSIFRNKWLLFNFLYGPIATFMTYNCMLRIKSLNNFQKVIIVFIVVVEVGAYIAVGTNKLVFDYVVIILTCVFLNIFYSTRRYKLCFKVFNRQTVIASFVILGALAFFGSTFSSRMEGQKDSGSYYNVISGTQINQKQLSVLPKDMQEPILGFESYLTQGLEHLDQALGMEFKWCYGLGSSRYLTKFLGRFGISDKIIENRTYEERIANRQGVKNGQYWYSFYVAYANDITFIFVPLLIFFLAVMWGHYYRACLETDDWTYFPIFILLTICFFYLNANNQIFGKAQLISFIPLYIFSKLYSVKYKI